MTAKKKTMGAKREGNTAVSIEIVTQTVLLKHLTRKNIILSSVDTNL